MRKSMMLTSWLLAVTLLLAACSGGGVSDTEPGQPNLPAEQDAGNEPGQQTGDAEEQGEVTANDEDAGEEVEEYADTGFDPTPSPPFRQSYEPNSVSDRDYSEYEIITLLAQDGIPALDFPGYLTANEADESYLPGEQVIGVEFNGDARAYSVPLLSRHEIVNDTVGGIHLSVTW